MKKDKLTSSPSGVDKETKDGRPPQPGKELIHVGGSNRRLSFGRRYGDLIRSDDLCPWAKYCRRNTN